MSYKLQSPRMSNAEVFNNIVVEGCGSSLQERSSDFHLLRSWYEYDAEAAAPASKGGFNWKALLGMTILVGISAAFWVGVGALVSRIWK